MSNVSLDTSAFKREAPLYPLQLPQWIFFTPSTSAFKRSEAPHLWENGEQSWAGGRAGTRGSAHHHSFCCFTCPIQWHMNCPAALNPAELFSQAMSTTGVSLAWAASPAAWNLGHFSERKTWGLPSSWSLPPEEWKFAPLGLKWDLPSVLWILV